MTAVSEWLDSLPDSRLTEIAGMVAHLQKLRKAAAAAPPPDVVDSEVDHILAIRDARRAEAAIEREARGLRMLERRLRRYNEGRLGMCDCRPCLSGYVAGIAAQNVALALSRMCDMGRQQFSNY
jgi:RNA polymerase-binding transcription factor DksA